MRDAERRSKVCLAQRSSLHQIWRSNVVRLHILQAQSILEQAVVDIDQQDEMRLQRSVEAGLTNAQARVLPESIGGSSNASTSSTGRTEGDGSQSAAGSPPPANGVSQQSHNDAQQGQVDKNASSSSDRPQGSQLSAAEKQKQAVDSVS